MMLVAAIVSFVGFSHLHDLLNFSNSKFGQKLEISLSRTKVQKFSLDKPHKIQCDPFLLLSLEFEVVVSSCEVVRFLKEVST
jgi:hypothetical protein